MIFIGFFFVTEEQMETKKHLIEYKSKHLKQEPKWVEQGGGEEEEGIPDDLDLDSNASLLAEDDYNINCEPSVDLSTVAFVPLTETAESMETGKLSYYIIYFLFVFLLSLHDLI